MSTAGHHVSLHCEAGHQHCPHSINGETEAWRAKPIDSPKMLQRVRNGARDEPLSGSPGAQLRVSGSRTASGFIVIYCVNMASGQ